MTAAPADTAVESITVIIDIDDSVRDLVDDSMRLFIYARNPAMSMPLAARNIPLPEFPYEIILDDSMAMMPNLVLSSADKVIVGARLSRSGQASAQPGDIQAVSEPFVPAEQNGPMHLMIREIVGQ
jgi:cytochrome c-type biogenesis protein CcmH